METVEVIPEEQLGLIPEDAVRPGGRITPEFFFQKDGSPQPWISDAMEHVTGVGFPRQWLPYRVALSDVWWDDGWNEAEAWLKANTHGPWMLWIIASGLRRTQMAVFFRRMPDAILFKLAMPT
jgi:hypothetical protein